MEYTLSSNIRAMSCYDEDKSSYVLRQGDYIIRLGNASNNTSNIAVLENSIGHNKETIERIINEGCGGLICIIL